VSQRILGYARRDARGLVKLERFGESLSEAEVEISDDVCILRADDAQKVVEPPRLTKLTVEPGRVQVPPKAQVAFKAAGVDQYGQAYTLGSVEWMAPGCAINSSGQVTAGEAMGIYRVTARAAGLEAEAEMTIAPTQGPKDGPPGPGKGRVIRWSGIVPPQKWMNFYTKVLTRFVGSPGLVLNVSFEAPADADQAKGKAEETKAALKELGLNDSVESGG
jgi:hypothetical protein